MRRSASRRSRCCRRGFHVLPFFHPIDGADAGFDPIDHTQVDPRLGTWDDVAALAARTEVMADVIVNHVSSRSPQFLDYDSAAPPRHTPGCSSPMTACSVAAPRVGSARAAHASSASFPSRSTGPRTAKTCCCGPRSPASRSTSTSTIPEGRRYLADVLDGLHAAGIRAIRLDAVGFAVKKAGTSCFMIPETFAFIADFTAQAQRLGMDVLVEVHGHYQDQIDVARQVDWVYDFALPPLVLHALYARRDAPEAMARSGRATPSPCSIRTTASACRTWTPTAAERAPGCCRPEDIDALVEDDSRAQPRREPAGQRQRREQRGRRTRSTARSMTRSAGATTSILIARAIQCFVPGIPQIYYVGLLAGGNDIELLRRTGVGRDINRHYYADGELAARSWTRPVVQALLRSAAVRSTIPRSAVPSTLVVRRGPARAGMAERFRLVAWRSTLTWMRRSRAPIDRSPAGWQRRTTLGVDDISGNSKA